MIHLRAVSPTALTPAVLDALRGDDTVHNLVVLPGSAADPAGDTIQLDLLNGGANRVLESLRRIGVVEQGSVVIETVDAALSVEMDSAERRQSRFESFTPIWELVDARIRADSIYPPSWYLLIVIAGMIGAVGILINSQILIVAAMVVGPEYSAITAIARAGTYRDARPIRRGFFALGVGFTAAIIAAFLLGEVIRVIGRTPAAFDAGYRPVSNLINTPNIFSVIVAVLAGMVGIISLTESRAAALIGVFISVTTIPAAADIGLSAGYSAWDEAWGSFVQLLLNVGILIVVGMVMLIVQKRLWDRAEPIAARRNLR